MLVTLYRLVVPFRVRREEDDGVVLHLVRADVAVVHHRPRADPLRSLPCLESREALGGCRSQKAHTCWYFSANGPRWRFRWQLVERIERHISLCNLIVELPLCFQAQGSTRP